MISSSKSWPPEASRHYILSSQISKPSLNTFRSGVWRNPVTYYIHFEQHFGGIIGNFLLFHKKFLLYANFSTVMAAGWRSRHNGVRFATLLQMFQPQLLFALVIGGEGQLLRAKSRYLIAKPHTNTWVRDIEVGIDACYGLNCPEIESRCERYFPSFSDRPCGPPSLL